MTLIHKLSLTKKSEKDATRERKIRLKDKRKEVIKVMKVTCKVKQAVRMSINREPENK
jgi:hypothetical protein